MYEITSVNINKARNYFDNHRSQSGDRLALSQRTKYMYRKLKAVYSAAVQCVILTSCGPR